MRAHFAGAIVLAGVFSGCRSSTQIDVSVSTDLSCPRVSGTAITTGTLGQIESLPPAATTRSCAGDHIGSVVLVPSGDDHALVGFKVVTAINGENVDDCTPGDGGTYGPNCIVARRALRYLPHTSLTVAVLMAGACAGIACDAQSTCVEGRCVPATIDNPSQCEGNGCGEGVLGSGDAGAPDATLSDAGPTDAAPAEAEATDAPGDAPGDAPAYGPTPPCDLRGLQADAAWPMEGYCPYGRVRSPLVGPHQQPSYLWSVDLPGGGGSAPSVGADGTVYVTSLGGVVQALQPSDGGVLWSSAPFGDAGVIWSMPVLAADDTVRVFDFTQPASYAVLSLDGGVRLTVPIPPIRGGVTVVGDGTMLAADTFGSLDAINPEGQIVYQVAQRADDFTKPSVSSKGTIFSNDNNGTVYAILDGGEAWHRSLDAGSGGTSTPQIAVDGTLRVASYLDAIYALDPATGAILWQVQVLPGLGDMYSMALGDDGTTYVGSSGGLFAYDRNGKPVGSYTGFTVQAPMLDAQGYVYASSPGNGLVAFDPACNLKWQVTVPNFPAGASIQESPVIGPGGMVYVAVTNGTATALEAFGPTPP